VQSFFTPKLAKEFVFRVINGCVDGRLVVARDQTRCARPNELELRKILVLAVFVMTFRAPDLDLQTRLWGSCPYRSFDMFDALVEIRRYFRDHLKIGRLGPDVHTAQYTSRLHYDAMKQANPRAK
jgi:hypothetical protein